MLHLGAIHMSTPNPKFMFAAIEMARASRAAGDYAVGSVIVRDLDIIAQAGNRTHLDQDPTHHAEILAIRQAAQYCRSKDLSSCTLYTTHEPCAMCMGAVIWSRIPRVVFGATMEDHKRHRDRHGNTQWPWRVIDIRAGKIAAASSPVVELVGGFMRQECLDLFHS